VHADEFASSMKQSFEDNRVLKLELGHEGGTILP